MKKPQFVKPISDTEHKILEMLADGFMPTEIAAILGRSVNTVSTHLARIKRKTGLKSTIHIAVQWALMRAYADAEYRSWLN
jgi:DNA-binding CsgD family transcriptional regulator